MRSITASKPRCSAILSDQNGLPFGGRVGWRAVTFVGLEWRILDISTMPLFTVEVKRLFREPLQLKVDSALIRPAGATPEISVRCPVE